VIDAQRSALCEMSVFHYSFVINAVASMRERSLVAIANVACDLPDAPSVLPAPSCYVPQRLRSFHCVCSQQAALRAPLSAAATVWPSERMVRMAACGDKAVDVPHDKA
jgi:hypothetical protein